MIPRFLHVANGSSTTRTIAEAGIPGLLYGPGGRYLSIPDERVKVDDIVLASRVFCSVIEQIWGLGAGSSV